MGGAGRMSYGESWLVPAMHAGTTGTDEGRVVHAKKDRQLLVVMLGLNRAVA